MKVTVTSMYHTCKEYEDVEKTDIESIAAKYGSADDCVELRDVDDTLIAYAVWKQGYNHYLFCKAPQANFPCDIDILN